MSLPHIYVTLPDLNGRHFGTTDLGICQILRALICYTFNLELTLLVLLDAFMYFFSFLFIYFWHKKDLDFSPVFCYLGSLFFKNQFN